MMTLVAIVVGYLIGSIPNAYIFGKLYKQIDIREHGSGNMGATNVFRVLGKAPGVLVLILDILKGLIAVAVVADILGVTAVNQRILVAISAVSGHNWTVFLKFKGGKGIATSLGALIGLTIRIPSVLPVLLLTLAIWAGVFLTTRIVSLSSMVAATFLPVAMAVTHQPLGLICLGVLLCLFVVLRHRPNIRRLLAKEEPRVPLRFGKK